MIFDKNGMNFIWYSCFALPVGAAVFALYYILSKAGIRREKLIAKCTVTFLSVASAGLAICLRGGNLLTNLVFWFFVLCTAADALLEIRFVPGMLLFGTAHFCLILWMAGRIPGTGRHLPPALWILVLLLLWMLLTAFVLLLFRKELRRLGRKRLPFCLYAALLAASLALGVSFPYAAGKPYLTLAVGTLCFFASDMMVGKATLSSLPCFLEKPTMGLYWGGLYLISAALWIA